MIVVLVVFDDNDLTVDYLEFCDMRDDAEKEVFHRNHQRYAQEYGKAVTFKA